MTCASPFTENPPVASSHCVEPPPHVADGRFVDILLQVIFFGNPDDDVHHIRETATADAALAELVVDLRGHDQLPRIDVEKAADDGFDVAVGNHVAVADEHGMYRPLRSPSL